MPKFAGCLKLILKNSTKIKIAQMLYAILIRPHLWYWCYGIIDIHKTMVDKILKLERKIIKTILGLPKSTDNKVIEVFTS